MARYTIQTPDGRKVTVEADSEQKALEGVQRWAKENPVQTRGVVEDAAWQAPQGFNEGLDDLLNLPGTVINLPFQAAGYDAPFERQEVFSQFNPGGAVDEAVTGNTETVAPETRLGEYSRTTGRVLGGTVAPTGGMIAAGARATPQAINAGKGLLARAAKDPVRTAAYDTVASVGGGTGIEIARGEELGPTGEFIGGMIGSVAAPFGYASMAKMGDALKSGYRYGNQMVEAAKSPQQAAINSVADAMTDANVPPSDVRAAVAPQMSANLNARGFSADDIADIVSRKLQGEASDSIGQQYGIAGSTVDKYAQTYVKANPTPMNIADIATELRGPGGAMPVLRQGRANFGIADDSADAAQALYDRQTEQSGRTANIIQQSGARNQSFEGELDRLAGIAKQEEDAAYTLARQQAMPVQIDDVLRDARSRAFSRQGEIGEQYNKAIDLFFEPEMRQSQQAPMTRLRITEARERLDDALQSGADQETVSKLERRLNTLVEQDDFSRALRLQKVGEPTKDISRYLDARQELDQMIERSYQDNKPTTLTQVLTDFRTKLNQAARQNNPELAKADARFSGNRTVEKILERGFNLGKRLTPDTREAMREFRDMTPSQQELFRVAFEQRLADDALNVRQTGGAANQFGTKAFEELIEAFYPAPPKTKGKLTDAQKVLRKAQQAVHDRGQEILRNLRREAISTSTTNFMTGRGNSPTAPWTADMNAQMENARAAADVATGRVGRLLENLSNRLAKQIGQRAASEELKILTETDPAELLRILNQLEAAAKNSASRKALVHQLRQARKPEFRIPAMVGTGQTAASQNVDGQ